MSWWQWIAFDYLIIAFAISLLSLLGAHVRRRKGEAVKLSAFGNVFWSLFWPYILYITYQQIKRNKNGK